MDEVKILKFKGIQHLNEVYQITQMTFAFVTKQKDGTYKQETPFVLCRDFLHDAIKGQIQQKKMAVYGFIFDPKAQTVFMNKTLLIVRHMGFTTNMIDNICHILHLFEKRLRIKKTVVYGTNIKNTFLFEGSKTWLSSPPFISLYTLLMRVAANRSTRIQEGIASAKTFSDLMRSWKEGRYEEIGGDAVYLQPLGKYLQTVLSNRSKLGLTLKETFEKDNSPITLFHNYNGIMSLCKRNFAQHNEEMYKKHTKMINIYLKKGKGKIKGSKI